MHTVPCQNKLNLKTYLSLHYWTIELDYTEPGLTFNFRKGMKYDIELWLYMNTQSNCRGSAEWRCIGAIRGPSINNYYTLGEEISPLGDPLPTFCSLLFTLTTLCAQSITGHTHTVRASPYVTYYHIHSAQEYHTDLESSLCWYAMWYVLQISLWQEYVIKM